MTHTAVRYFEARPNLFARQPESYHETSQSQPAAMAASAVHRTMASNPQATADLISSGLKTIPKGSQYSAVSSQFKSFWHSLTEACQASNPIIANAAGRFAASSLTSSFNNSAQAAKSPPAPPRRGISGGEDSPSPGRPAPSGGSGGLSSLMSSKVSTTCLVPAQPIWTSEINSTAIWRCRHFLGESSLRLFFQRRKARGRSTVSTGTGSVWDSKTWLCTSASSSCRNTYFLRKRISQRPT